MVNLFYYISTDKAWLDDVNRRGLPLGQRDGTHNWVNILKHPDRDEWTAELQEDYLPRLAEVLTAEEMATVSDGLKTKEQMQADGWPV